MLHAANGLLVADFRLDQTQLPLRQLVLGIQHEENRDTPNSYFLCSASRVFCAKSRETFAAASLDAKG